MRIVLDTNVLISALLNPEGSPAVLLGLIVNGKLKLLYDNRILTEYIEVLNRKKFNFKPEWIEPLIDFIRKEGEFIIAHPISKSFKDGDDKKFYEVAKSGNAKYIITGNVNHFPKEDIVKSPKEFFDQYRSNLTKFPYRPSRMSSDILNLPACNTASFSERSFFLYIILV